jgi:hypothetical protein
VERLVGKIATGFSSSIFDIAGGDFTAALELIVEPFKDAASLLAAIARTFEGQMIAALIGGDAEPPLDQRKVLAVLAKQR